MLPLGFLEQFINRSLRYDPIAQAALVSLSGKKIRVRTTTPDLQFFAILGSDIVLLQDIDEKVDLEIEGPSFGFLRQAFTSGDSIPAAGPLRLMGDAQLAQSLMQLLQNLDIDWEEALAKRVGDVAAHQIGHTARNLFRWAKKAGRTLLQDVDDYVRVETRAIANRAELDQFSRDVDNIRFDTDRLEARVRALTARLESE